MILSFLLVEVICRMALFCIRCNDLIAFRERTFRGTGGYMKIDLT